MKKSLILLLALVLAIMCTACTTDEAANVDMEPQVSQMKSICELAVMKCYYHNVAKYHEEDASGILWWQRDKHFWVEYSGVVTLGVDVSLVSMEIDGNTVTVTMPEAEVQGCTVDSDSLTADSFIVAKDSASIVAEDEIAAFSEAQARLREAAANDRPLLAEAQQRAKSLIEDYVSNIGRAVGTEYLIQWIDVDADGNELGASESLPPASDSETQLESGSEPTSEDQ